MRKLKPHMQYLPNKLSTPTNKKASYEETPTLWNLLIAVERLHYKGRQQHSIKKKHGEYERKMFYDRSGNQKATYKAENI